MKRVKKYPIIGGPLDGEYANTKDFWTEYVSTHYNREAGQFAEYNDDYTTFNSGDSRSVVSMVFLHKSLLREAIREPQ
jgi:hypothetical protein